MGTYCLPDFIQFSIIHWHIHLGLDLQVRCSVLVVSWACCTLRNWRCCSGCSTSLRRWPCDSLRESMISTIECPPLHTSDTWPLTSDTHIIRSATVDRPQPLPTSLRGLKRLAVDDEKSWHNCAVHTGDEESNSRHFHSHRHSVTRLPFLWLLMNTVLLIVILFLFNYILIQLLNILCFHNGRCRHGSLM